MNRINTCLLIAALLGTLMGAGCKKKQPTLTREQVIEEKLAERLDRWRIEMNRKCTRQVEEKAVNYVDSIVLVNARSNRDVSDVPNIPGRPVRPDFRPPEDTTPVQPILKNRQDTLKH